MTTQQKRDQPGQYAQTLSKTFTTLIYNQISQTVHYRENDAFLKDQKSNLLTNDFICFFRLFCNSKIIYPYEFKFLSFCFYQITLFFTRKRNIYGVFY